MDPTSKLPGAPTERLAFNFPGGAVPSRRAIEEAIAAGARPSFATAAFAAEARDWGYLGLLAFTAVLLFRPQDTFPALVSLHIAELCAILGILPMVIHRFAQRLPVFRITAETGGLLALGAVMLMTTPFSIWPGGAVEVFSEYAKIVIVFILMMNTLTSTKRIEQLTWLVVLACGYVGLRACVDYARGINLTEGDRAVGAVSGMFGNPNDLALNMVTFFPVAALLVMNRNAPPIRRLIAAGIAAVMLLTIVFTKSRGGFLGLGAMLIALVFLTRKIRPGFGIALFFAVLTALPLMPASFWDRMSTIFDEEQDKAEYTGSAEARRIVMEEGLRVFAEFPLTGVGAGQFKNYNPPERRERWLETHNALIQVAAELGIGGVLAFVYLIGRAAIAAAATRRLLSKPRKRNQPDLLARGMEDAERQTLYAHTAAMTAGLVGWFVCAFFASVAYSWTFYYLLALTVVARELTVARLAAVAALADEAAKRPGRRMATFSRRMVNGVA